MNMTQEQLEAHRVRFEQRYAQRYNYGVLDIFKSRLNDSAYPYSTEDLSKSWQAYQWAIADADRAQRATQPPQQVEQSAEFAGWQHRVYYTDNNDPGWSNWREVLECDMGTIQKLSREYPQRHQMRPVYTAPQQSAQPVAHVSCDGVMGVRFTEHADFGCALKVGQPLYAAAQPVEAANGWEKGLDIRMSQGWKLKSGICPVLYSDTVNGYGVGRDDLWLATTATLKSAQPVEVQRVPMTNRQVYDVMSYLVTEPEPFEAAVSDAETWVEVMEMIRAIEAFHGIKPTTIE